MSNSNSPYDGIQQDEWIVVTQSLVDKHPLKDELVDIVFQSWNDIFASNIGGFRIGVDIFPEPQIMGFFLHDLIALRISQKFPDYKLGNPSTEKDIQNVIDNFLSIEIKTSSHKSKVYANRSYAQPSSVIGKKDKDGYFLTVNFEKFDTNRNTLPGISIIRFGYLEHSDWVAQAAATGQQAHLAPITYKTKFVTLYDKSVMVNP